MTSKFDGLPAPAEFLNVELIGTFGKREAELTAELIVSYCAEVGRWDCARFQLERLVKIGDLADADILNGGHSNGLYTHGLSSLTPLFVDAQGVRREFVQRLCEQQAHWVLQHPIVRRLHKAVARKVSNG